MSQTAPMPSVDLVLTNGSNAPRVVRSVVHASGLLKALHKAGRPTSLSDLARKISLSKPATYSLLKTLELLGFITRDATARYQLGWGLYELGSAVVRTLELARIARPHLDRLAKKTGEAVLLSILDNNAVLYLDCCQSGEAFKMIANSGRRSPLHTNASGKVLLAFQGKAYLDAFVRYPLAPTTSLTITSADRLRAELQRVREHGYATCAQEQEIGLSSIAVPVSGSEAYLAALAIAGPATHLTTVTQQSFLAALKSAAVEISQQLT